ncbi:MAG: sugar ABC transporter permease, partial [Firmicutes bacterium]|nr:sugar ABC transporter permease [Bacillota bacterium]
MKESKFSLRVDLKTYMMVIALVAIWLIFTGITGGTFLSPRNLSNLFRQSVFTSILAIGMVMVIITGHIDLSAGSLAGLTGGIVSILHVWRGWNPYPSIAVTLIVGLALGLWNGYWVAYKKVPAFIVTLGGLLVFRGALVGITKGTTIGPMGELFRYIGKGYLPEYGGIILAV